jgi:dihydrodipicolinate synthase/N-acetylneuraminate lyase
MAGKLVHGVYAAVLTPRRADDSIDTATLAALIRFLISKGISSFAMNGATGEFCLTTPEQLRTILETVRKASGGAAELLCGVGAPGIAGVKELAAVAESTQVKALLLPMPCFFPYNQQDLELFSREAAASTTLPVLLYNLPQFTSGLNKETVRRLILEVPNIIGIKDSSGSLDILSDLTAHNVDACRIVGNDSALAPALTQRVCDGVVSGVACALPEVIQALYAEAEHTESAEFANAARLLNEFIEQLATAPTPWGLKWMAEARGIITATFSQPVTASRRAQGQSMAAWLKGWLPEALAAVAKAESVK